MTKAPIAYYGSKGRVVADIVAQMPAHKCYVEPFGGSAVVLLNKAPSATEILNDQDDALVNLYRVLRLDPARLKKALHLTPYSRTEHAACCRRLRNPALKHDMIEWARTYYVATCQSYGGIVKNPSFSTSPEKGLAMTWCRRIDERLDVVTQRLRGVTIENRPAIDVIERYDRTATLHYCDPPYHPDTRTVQARTQGKYMYEMTAADHVRLLDVLRSVKGKVLLSGFDHPLYAKMLKGWRVCWRKRLQQVSATTVKSRKAHFREDVLWANW
jgi:DNA adenine methylase